MTPTEHMIQRTPPGMMFWSGTCREPDRICGECLHWKEFQTGRFGCGLYKKHMGVGKPIPKTTPACKFFEPKP